MIIVCDVHPKTTSICISREIPERKIQAGCLFYAYGSIAHPDTILDNSFQAAVEIVSGMVAQTIETVGQGESCTDLQHVATQIASALKQANRIIWELNHCVGQGIYVSGLIAYFCNDQYIAIPFGGANALLFSKNKLRCLNTLDEDRLIRDAVGARPEWTGCVLNGTLMPGSILFGTTGLPQNWGNCERLLTEHIGSEINLLQGAEVMRQTLDVALDNSAVIEFSTIAGGKKCGPIE